jgi:plastocyanin
MKSFQLSALLLCLVATAWAQTQTVSAHFQVVEESGKRADPSNVVVWLTPRDSTAEPGPTPVATEPRPRLVQRNKTFSPHLLVVTAGSTVEFPNKDPFFHNVFSLFEGKRFDLGLYEAGTARIVHFDRPGVCYIFCNIHPEMSAVVLVLDTPYYGISDEAGNVTVSGVPPGQYTAHIWYEGVVPEQLKKLARPFVVTSTSHSLGSIRLVEVKGLLMSHKNKYGREYDKPTPSSPVYVQP